MGKIDETGKTNLSTNEHEFFEPQISRIMRIFVKVRIKDRYYPAEKL